jgi:hypothetical protein
MIGIRFGAPLCQTVQARRFPLGEGAGAPLERFPVKWIPVRAKKMRKDMKLVPRSD